MAESPFLSILIPTRNRADYLKYAIQSALNVDSLDIEVIVSENYGSDNAWEVANSFSDSRLTILRPPTVVPMHEHFEFLLSKASGKWITFLGDDDAVMSHCAKYLAYLESRYPEAEAIVSPRAYYFWEHAYSPGDQSMCSFSLSHKEVWRDSKQALDRCLRNQTQYICLPQIYSGGFQRSSLVRRVIRLQGGHYFRSVSPDAYSAVMATLHTYRYLEVGVPMIWVGTSPSSKIHASAKNREQDFCGMHDDAFSMNPCLGSAWMSWPFLIHFYEAYLAAAPFTSSRDLSWDRVRQIYTLAAKDLILHGDRRAAADLAASLGVKPADSNVVILSDKLMRLSRRFRRLSLGAFLSALKRLRELVGAKKTVSDYRYFCYEASGDQCSDILALDPIVKQAYDSYSAVHLGS